MKVRGVRPVYTMGALVRLGGLEPLTSILARLHSSFELQTRVFNIGRLKQVFPPLFIAWNKLTRKAHVFHVGGNMKFRSFGSLIAPKLSDLFDAFQMVTVGAMEFAGPISLHVFIKPSVDLIKVAAQLPLALSYMGFSVQDIFSLNGTATALRALKIPFGEVYFSRLNYRRIEKWSPRRISQSRKPNYESGP